ncbi:hypothetical protein GOP47_0019482 [Adiantum capillus-veneris]|uniref:BHLH domain-containing protein n=1 Tax=Adiantum capillus-veneris TaxID=13818 RepID=A0A9D4UBK1_ADICA|nr:hypothetical protein GOP47_0019482 [Adiantum capillus-veneris]
MDRPSWDAPQITDLLHDSPKRALLYEETLSSLFVGSNEVAPSSSSHSAPLEAQHISEHGAICAHVDHLGDGQALLNMRIAELGHLANGLDDIISIQETKEDLLNESVALRFNSTGVYSQKELQFLEAALQPIDEEKSICSFQTATSRRGLASRPGAKNSSISTEPQSVAARQRRGRIRQKLRELQRLVPGGGSMGTADLLNEAALYLAFLQEEVHALADGTSRLLSRHQ